MIGDFFIKGENIISISSEPAFGKCGDAIMTIVSANPKKIKKEKENLPKKYIINKNAVILFWKDGTKTIIKRQSEDEYNKKLGFLIAYFQKNSGLSRNQANKYLDSLIDEEEEKNILNKIKGEKL